MRLSIDARLDYSTPYPTDVLLMLEVAQMADQRLISDQLTVGGGNPLTAIAGGEAIGQSTWVVADGPFRVGYIAEVEVERPAVALAGLKPAARPTLPSLVIPYIWPSRYCESDRFEGFVGREFARFEGGDKVLAITDWIGAHVDYCAGSSDATTTAADSFVQRAGVCRDFAHLTAALVRAAGMPARLVSAYAANIEPPDFHAVVEVWLDDGWHLVDATRLANVQALARIAVGRDATDIAFMTAFGRATLNRQSVVVSRID